MGEPAGKIIRLTEDEALLLFEWLHRSEEADSVVVPTPGEQVALWNLSCLLETALVEPLSRNYAALVDAAERRIGESTADGEDGETR